MHSLEPRCPTSTVHNPHTGLSHLTLLLSSFCFLTFLRLFHPLFLTFLLLIRNDCYWCRKATRSRCLVTLTLRSPLSFFMGSKSIEYLYQEMEEKAYQAQCWDWRLVPSPVVLSRDLESFPLLDCISRAFFKKRLFISWTCISETLLVAGEGSGKLVRCWRK